MCAHVCMCVWDLLSVTNWDATQRYAKYIAKESNTFKMFTAEKNKQKLLYLVMPPSAESCLEGTLVSVGKGQAECRRKPPLSTLFKCHFQGGNLDCEM